MFSLTDDGNPLNYDRSTRADWAKGHAVPTFEEGMEVLYFVGCYYSYDPRLKKAATATARVSPRPAMADRRFELTGMWSNSESTRG